MDNEKVEAMARSIPAALESACRFDEDSEFNDAWAVLVKRGWLYGPDALENAHTGWVIARVTATANMVPRAVPDEYVRLVERLRSSAKAFRENTVYDSEGDPIRLIVQADEDDEAATALESLVSTNADLERQLVEAREALRIIARAETTVFDEDEGCEVFVAMDEEEMSEIARAQLAKGDG